MKQIRILVLGLAFLFTTISPVFAEPSDYETINNIDIISMAQEGEVSIINDTVQIHKTTQLDTVQTRTNSNIEYYESTTVGLIPLTDSISTDDIYNAVPEEQKVIMSRNLTRASSHVDIAKYITRPKL